MKHKDFAGIVPSQYTGKELEADASIECKDENDAKSFYNISKERLLNVNNWHRLAGIISARFQLIDAHGREVTRNAEKGDYLKIDIPGPGSKEGDGYDWVCIEELKEVNEATIQTIGFRVRPSHNPLSDKNNIAHFYDDSATSSFIITRDGTTVSAVIIDRNIKPNDDTASVTDKMRHTVIGISAIGAFSKMQWQNLAEGLVKK